MYTVYFGTRGSGGLGKTQLSSKRFSSLPEALIWAHGIAERGNSVIRLEGNDGTDLSRSDLACAFRLLTVNDDRTSGKDLESDDTDHAAGPRAGAASIAGA